MGKVGGILKKATQYKSTLKRERLKKNSSAKTVGVNAEVTNLLCNLYQNSDPVIIRNFIEIFYTDLVKCMGQINQREMLKHVIYKVGLGWLGARGILIPKAWGISSESQFVRVANIRKKALLSVKAGEFKSAPLNSGKRKKINKEMDRILKKIEENKVTQGDKPRKKLKERIHVVSGGLPGLGKRR